MSKEFKRAPVARLVEYMKTHDMPATRMCAAMGYSTTAIAGWISDGHCPAVVDELVKAWNEKAALFAQLEAERTAKASENGSHFFAALVPTDKLEYFKSLCGGFGISPKHVV